MLAHDPLIGLDDVVVGFCCCGSRRDRGSETVDLSACSPQGYSFFDVALPHALRKNINHC